MTTLSDANYSLRLLLKTPGFSGICLVVIVLGLTVILSIYSLLYEVRYKDLPFPGGDRFVALKASDKNTGIDLGEFVSNAHVYNAIRANVTGFEVFGGFQQEAIAISDDESIVAVSSASITPNLLHSTSVLPIMGRLFDDDDAIPGAPETALISFQLWQNYYNADSEIIGKQSRINGSPRTIIGVMPEGFAYPIAHNIWVPLSVPESAAIEDESHRIVIAGVLTEDSNLNAINNEIDSVLARLAEEMPSKYGNIKADVSAHALVWIGGVGGIGTALFVVTGLVLSLICLNLATLLFVRANSRRQELAIRNALGASRGQIVLQILLESLILCIAGMLAALMLSNLLLTAIENGLTSLMANSSVDALPFWFELGIGNNSILVASVLTAVVWLVSGSYAAFSASGKDLNQILESGSKGATGSKQGRTAKVVVGFEIVFSCFLLILCGLLLLSTNNMQNTEFGGSSEGLSVATYELVTTAYESPQSRLRYIQNLEQELLALGSVEEVSFTTAIPGWVSDEFPSFALEDRDVRLDDRYPRQGVVWVAGNYFDLLNIELLQGRYFSGNDNTDSLPTVIVDQLFAENMWPGESAIGKRVQLDPDSNDVSQWLTIVGVVPHILQGDPIAGQKTQSTFYRPVYQETPIRVQLVAKHTSDFSLAEFRQQLATAGTRVDRDIPFDSAQRLVDAQRIGITLQGAIGRIFGGIAITTFVLAIIGIYAVISRSITQRTSEIGIRRALGSSAGSVIRIFVTQGVLFLVVGILVGGGAAILVSTVLTAVYDDLLSWLVPVFLVVTGTIGAMIFLASYVPARTAVRMEPGDALRYE
ncbi:MAG: hypothetical protein COB20_09865 [SAR86 cluster bacterium]|uniref:ABC transporter permease n=1 Tax=SAR86 cluster bacterium TaxID=2030880 RepID=A0A2A4X360_9GAMM|nr:MAG: hypothetical protein COB20_09865 [SAR86 cluster bacterium]